MYIADLPIVQLRKIAGDPPLGLSSQPLQEHKRLLKQLHEEGLELARHAVLHQQLVYAVHGQRSQVARVVRGVRSAVAAQAGKVEDGVQDAGGDDAAQWHPTEEMGQAPQSQYAYLFSFGVQRSVGCVSGNYGSVSVMSRRAQVTLGVRSKR